MHSSLFFGFFFSLLILFFIRNCYGLENDCDVNEPHMHEIKYTEQTPREISEKVLQHGNYLKKQRKLSQWNQYCNDFPTKLRFNDDGTFKIAIFTDLHYGEGENEAWGSEQDTNSTMVMKSVLHVENPDFIVFDGDQITGNNIYFNATTYMNEVYQPAIQHCVKWSLLFGNHDDLSSGPGETRSDLMAFDQTYDLSYSRAGPKNLTGVSNYYLELYDNVEIENEIPKAIFYYFDSGGGKEQSGYIFPDQVEWYKSVSTYITKKYNQVIYSIAFFHIPLQEYIPAYSEKNTCVGYKNESVAYQTKNTGLFQAFLDQTDVKAMFCGHNHRNDYCCDYKGLYTCYGRHTGYGGYGDHNPELQGSRMIELYKNNQTNTIDFNTWIRVQNGSISNLPTNQ